MSISRTMNTFCFHSRRNFFILDTLNTKISTVMHFCCINCVYPLVCLFILFLMIWKWWKKATAKFMNFFSMELALHWKLDRAFLKFYFVRFSFMFCCNFQKKLRIKTLDLNELSTSRHYSITYEFIASLLKGLLNRKNCSFTDPTNLATLDFQMTWNCFHS